MIVANLTRLINAPAVKSRLDAIQLLIRFWLGYRAYWSGRFVDAQSHLEPLAKNGDAASQYYIGRMSARGEGQTRDLANAVRWWNASAGAGEPWAQMAIGSLYERGLGVGRDRSKAIKWYLKAAHAGLCEAQVRVGYFYDSGLGVEKDHANARRWYVRAAAQSATNLHHSLFGHHWRRLERLGRPGIAFLSWISRHQNTRRWSKRPRCRHVIAPAPDVAQAPDAGQTADVAQAMMAD